MDSLIFDSARITDSNGFMHVGHSPITKEQVREYAGIELPQWEELGLEPMKKYNVYCPAEELQKAAKTFHGLPLLFDHHPYMNAENPRKDQRVGSLGTDVIWEAPYLKAELIITDAEAIKAIEDSSQKELSAAYRFTPVFKSGVFEGQPYDIVMADIQGNHVALVAKGRAGSDVVVADSQKNLFDSEESFMRSALAQYATTEDRLGNLSFDSSQLRLFPEKEKSPSGATKQRELSSEKHTLEEIEKFKNYGVDGESKARGMIQSYITLNKNPNAAKANEISNKINAEAKRVFAEYDKQEKEAGPKAKAVLQAKRKSFRIFLASWQKKNNPNRGLFDSNSRQRAGDNMDIAQDAGVQSVVEKDIQWRKEINRMLQAAENLMSQHSDERGKQQEGVRLASTLQKSLAKHEQQLLSMADSTSKNTVDRRIAKNKDVIARMINWLKKGSSPRNFVTFDSLIFDSRDSGDVMQDADHEGNLVQEAKKLKREAETSLNTANRIHSELQRFLSSGKFNNAQIRDALDKIYDTHHRWINPINDKAIQLFDRLNSFIYRNKMTTPLREAKEDVYHIMNHMCKGTADNFKRLYEKFRKLRGTVGDSDTVALDDETEDRLEVRYKETLALAGMRKTAEQYLPNIKRAEGYERRRLVTEMLRKMGEIQVRRVSEIGRYCIKHPNVKYLGDRCISTIGAKWVEYQNKAQKIPEKGSFNLVFDAKNVKDSLPKTQFTGDSNMDENTLAIIAKYVDGDTFEKIKAELCSPTTDADLDIDDTIVAGDDEPLEPVETFGASDSDDENEIIEAMDADPLNVAEAIKAGENGEKRKVGQAMDSGYFIRALGARDELAKAVSPHIGTFAHERMTVGEVAKYAAKKLGLPVRSARDAYTAVRAYMHNRPVDYGKPMVAMDSAPRQSQVDDYLK